MLSPKLLAILLLSASAVINGVVSSCPDSKRIEPCFCNEDGGEAVATCSNLANPDALKKFARGSDGYSYKEVIIRDSNIDAIPRDFMEMASVASLALRNLKLRKLFDDVPNTRSTLKKLEMQNDEIEEEFTWKSFENTKSLRVLRIENVEIPIITTDLDQYVTHDLTEISFINTKTTKLEKDAMKNFRSLDVIHIVGNPIKAIHRKELPQPFQGTKLDFQRNQLESITDDLFTQMSNLQALYWNDNNISKILEPSEEGTIKRIKTIDVSGNPINCDCYFHWLIEMDLKNFKGTCSEPSPLRGKKLDALTEEDIQKCP